MKRTTFRGAVQDRPESSFCAAAFPFPQGSRRATALGTSIKCLRSGVHQPAGISTPEMSQIQWTSAHERASPSRKCLRFCAHRRASPSRNEGGLVGEVGVENRDLVARWHVRRVRHVLRIPHRQASIGSPSPRYGTPPYRLTARRLP